MSSWKFGIIPRTIPPFQYLLKRPCNKGRSGVNGCVLKNGTCVSIYNTSYWVFQVPRESDRDIPKPVGNEAPANPAPMMETQAHQAKWVGWVNEKLWVTECIPLSHLYPTRHRSLSVWELVLVELLHDDASQQAISLQLFYRTLLYVFTGYIGHLDGEKWMEHWHRVRNTTTRETWLQEVAIEFGWLTKGIKARYPGNIDDAYDSSKWYPRGTEY